METPDVEPALVLPLNGNDALDNPYTPQSLFKHPCEQLLSIHQLHLFLPVFEPESQLEDIISHEVDNDSLIVANLIFHVNNALILKVCIKYGTEAQDLYM